MDFAPSASPFPQVYLFPIAVVRMITDNTDLSPSSSESQKAKMGPWGCAPSRGASGESFSLLSPATQVAQLVALHHSNSPCVVTSHFSLSYLPLNDPCDYNGLTHIIQEKPHLKILNYSGEVPSAT